MVIEGILLAALADASAVKAMDYLRTENDGAR